MNAAIKGLFVLCLLYSIPQVRAYAQGGEIKIGIDEKLGQRIPASVVLRDEYGNARKLQDMINKPTILNLVFFECKGICTPILTEVSSIVNKLDLEPGKDYQILTVSFDPSETSALAAGKKVNYLKLLNRQIPADAWRFCTGDSASIAAITSAVGFKYLRDRDQFIHPGALILLSAEGKITRYLLGTTYNPFDVKMAIMEAGEGRVGPTIAKLLKMCYAYDPEGRTYALNFTRIAGTGMLALVIVFVLFLTSKPKKAKAI